MGLGDGGGEVIYVGEDEGGWAGETFVEGGEDGATPASLVEGGDLEGVGGGEGGEEVVVGVAVVTLGGMLDGAGSGGECWECLPEAVEEDDDGDGSGVGL